MLEASLYRVAEDQLIDAAWFNRLLGDVNTRLRGVEAIKAGLEDAVAQLQAVGLQRINDVVAPLIVQVQDDVVAVGEQLVTIAGQIEALLAGNLPAAYVTESAGRVFVTPEQRAQIAQIASDLGLKAAAADSVLTGVTQLANAIRLTGVASPPSINADAHNFAPAGLALAGRVRIVSNAPRRLTGLAGGEDGRQITIENLGAHDVTVRRESDSSLAANRFAIPADLDIAAGGGTVTLLYDGALARWTVMAGGKIPELPVGMIVQFEQYPGLPWLARDGATLLQSAYPTLFSLIGHRYIGDILSGVSIGPLDGVLGSAGYANGKYWLVSGQPGGVQRFSIWKSDTGLAGSWTMVGEIGSAYWNQSVGPLASDGTKTVALANNAFYEILAWTNGGVLGSASDIISGANVPLGKAVACIGGKFAVAVHGGGADGRIAYALDPLGVWTVVNVPGKSGSITGMLHNPVTGQIFTANGSVVHFADDPAGPWASAVLPTNCTAMCVLNNGVFLLSGPAGLFSCADLALADWTLVSGDAAVRSLTDLNPTSNGFALTDTRRLVSDQYVVASDFSAYAQGAGRAYCDGRAIIAPGGNSTTTPKRYPLPLDMSTQFSLATSSDAPPSYVKAK